MNFFVPNSKPGMDAQLYEDLAKMAGCAPAQPGKRIRLISFTHDGEDWIAEVGKPLTGVRVETKRRKTGKVVVRTPLSDRATVLAIFENVPYFVVTDAVPLSDVRSHWCNPFMAGRPTSVVFFLD